MRSIKDFFYPMIAFAVLLGGLLVFLLFQSAISNSTTQMAGNVTGGAVLWGWSWWSNGSVVVALCVLLFLCIGLWAIGKEWLLNRFKR